VGLWRHSDCLLATYSVDRVCAIFTSIELIGHNFTGSNIMLWTGFWLKSCIELYFCPHNCQNKLNLFLIFTARCYAERGYATLNNVVLYCISIEHNYFVQDSTSLVAT